MQRAHGAKRFEELDAWQLSVELSDRIGRELENEPVCSDPDFCKQLRDSARSAPRNIAEGFGTYKPRIFANFCRIARGSLMETKNHLLDAKRSGYFPDAVVNELLTLCNRATGATTGLLKYLDRCKGEAPSDWGNRRTRSRR